jgi:hypothetical protein
MKARRLIDGAAYGPEALKVIGQAFDEAWACIAGHFGEETKSVEEARLKLAEAVLSVASEDSCDVEALKRGALEAMALYGRSPPEPGPWPPQPSLRTIPQ